MLLVLSASLASLAAIAAVVYLAESERAMPGHCAPGLIAIGARCCGQGQVVELGRCVRVPSRCAAGMRIVDTINPGCVAIANRIRYSGGAFRFDEADWQASGLPRTRQVWLGAFELDATEVTAHRWNACVAAGRCAPLDKGAEPGVPVTNVSATAAGAFCRTMSGRLPSSDEWLLAAAGGEARRFAWGQTGLVCRRASFGLVNGPCAIGASGPDLAGARPDGVSPDGALDLSGNVAEWTVERNGAVVARGGSYKSRVAAELQTWAQEPGQGPAVHIGFRCAYDVEQH